MKDADRSRIRDLMDNEEAKARYLNSVEQRPGDLWPKPYYAHLDEMVFEATQWPEYVTPTFQLYNRWEAEYVRDKMHEVCPGRKYKMRWEFGGKLTRRTR